MCSYSVFVYLFSVNKHKNGHWNLESGKLNLPFKYLYTVSEEMMIFICFINNRKEKLIFFALSFKFSMLQNDECSESNCSNRNSCIVSNSGI